MARDESLFEDSRKHEFMRGLGLEGSTGLLNLFATLEELYNAECFCFECRARRGKQKSKKEDSALFRKKSPEHILADASIKGVQAHGEALSKHLFGSIQESHAENAELTKRCEELEVQLTEQEEQYTKEFARKSEEFGDILVNFRREVDVNESQIEQMQATIAAINEETVQLQKSIDGKVYALKQRAVEVENLKEEKDALYIAIDAIIDLVKKADKDSCKDELKDLIKDIAEVVKK